MGSRSSRSNDPAKPMNVVSPEWIEELIETHRASGCRIPRIKGAVITSAKSAFMAGADLKYIYTLAGGAITPQQAFEFSERPSIAMHRRLETCGKPFVAAINGLALGGGYELALACHYRVIVDDPKAVVGLPEVTVGLLPGSGGTQRLPRMIGIEKSLPVLLEGKPVGPAEALKLGMVDAVVPAAALMQAARQWILKSPDPVRAWDKKGYRSSGGLLNSAIANVMTFQPAAIGAKTQYNYPAPIAILDCIFEGTMMPFDKALRLESKYFAKLLCDPVSRNLIRTTFINKGEAMKLARRPKDVPAFEGEQIGRTRRRHDGRGHRARGGRGRHRGGAARQHGRARREGQSGRRRNCSPRPWSAARRSQSSADETLARIKATADYADLAQCDLVIEAVFEDTADQGRRDAQGGGGDTCRRRSLRAIPRRCRSPDSRRPLARPQQFIGLHFFSPVERMPLVEVIMGAETSQETLARSLDFVAQLKMTPIVVRDSRGFYTSRVFQTFIHEGMRMLEDGVAPALIENAAKFAGFPVGPLALVDEVTLELPWKIVKEAEAALGSKFVKPCAYEVMRRMLEEFKRPGKRYGKGFYEYPRGRGQAPVERPRRMHFRRRPRNPRSRSSSGGFSTFSPSRPRAASRRAWSRIPPMRTSGRCLAWGFPSWTGGPLSLIDTVGLQRIRGRVRGSWPSATDARFAPSKWLRDRAARGEAFYPA